MQTSKLHTLELVLTNGILIEGQVTPVPVKCIFIPKIQRAYAQGRKSETDVRQDFLEYLFNVLVSDEEKIGELSFLFGSKQDMAKKSGEGLELLDGQQRATTLFLLYWYLGMKELKKVPEFLKGFTYETRDTSVQFLNRITSDDFQVDLNQSSPAKAIKANKWFTDDFYCDPTVCAMLTMLDAIDDKYKTRQCSNLYGRLNRLQFYVLMLEKFDMNDELYIKMNSRGLSLVPFENFKASIVKFMKAKERHDLYGSDEVVGGKMPFWLEFISNIDAKWIDLFWKYKNDSQEECEEIIEIKDKEIGIRYLNFFNRYFYTKAVLAGRGESLSDFFYKDAESDKMKQRFFGWNYYEELLSIADYLRPISKVLNVLREDRAFFEDDVINDPYGNAGFNLNDESIIQYQRVLFAAVTEFIEHIPEGYTFKNDLVQENFKRMLRVVFNIMENTDINNEETMISVIRLCAEINSVDGATCKNFYHSLSLGGFKSNNQQLQEEITKAKEMFSNVSDPESFMAEWEEAFKEAESHPFFKGSVSFFFTPKTGNAQEFRDRYNVVKELFDKNGISATFRKDHLLIRAMIGQINYWGKGLEDRYITENAEKEKYLKMLLTTSNVGDMIREYFDKKYPNPIEDYLRDRILGAKPRSGESEEFCLLFKRLVNDTYSPSPALFDWICARESDKKRFRIQDRHSLLVHIPYSRYDRIILDTERHIIIPELVKTFSMDYDDNDQQTMINGPIKDASGWAINISKALGDFTLRLSFNESKWVDFFVLGKDTQSIAHHFGVTEPMSIDNEKVKVSSVKYQLFADKGSIENEINRIETELNKL